jgi:hypothetical protein
VDEVHRAQRSLLRRLQVRSESASERSPLVRLAALSLLLSVVVAGIALLWPFPHAAWLVAYLFLVGFLAQALLERGQAVLAGSRAKGRVPLQAALWNAGVIAVPIGVFTDARSKPADSVADRVHPPDRGDGAQLNDRCRSCLAPAMALI